jgi:hypothetical protein
VRAAYALTDALVQVLTVRQRQGRTAQEQVYELLRQRVRRLKLNAEPAVEAEALECFRTVYATIFDAG